MSGLSFSLLTVCGLEELSLHGERGVTHVLSILDPEQADPDAFGRYGEHERTVLRFHDTIVPIPGKMIPEPGHVEQIVDFGQSLARAAKKDAHLLVHCHAGISRSTAAMAMMMAIASPGESEADILERLVRIRPKAWPNSLMMGFADEQLGRNFAGVLGPLYKRQLVSYPNVRQYMLDNARGHEVAMADAV